MNDRGFWPRSGRRYSIRNFQFRTGRFGLAGEDPALIDLPFAQRLVAAHARLAGDHAAFAVGTNAGEAGIRRLLECLLYGVRQHFAAELLAGATGV